jgi:predicted nuclease of predicted toxin-antitoxin system
VLLKILLDENLSPTLADRLAEKGVLAQHIVYVGRDGEQDPNVWRYAYKHDQVVVTRNAADFIALAAGSELHAGLIVLRGVGLTRDETWARLEPVIDHVLANKIDLVNKLVEVRGPGDFEIRDLPQPTT